MLVERAAAVLLVGPVPGVAIPRQLGSRDQREALVVRLVDRTALRTAAARSSRAGSPRPVTAGRDRGCGRPRRSGRTGPSPTGRTRSGRPPRRTAASAAAPGSDGARGSAGRSPDRSAEVRASARSYVVRVRQEPSGSAVHETFALHEYFGYGKVSGDGQRAADHPRAASSTCSTSSTSSASGSSRSTCPSSWASTSRCRRPRS